MMTVSDYSIVKKVLMVLPFCLFTFLPLSAQTFTQRIQKNNAGEGTVTIHHDKAIDDLVNTPQNKTAQPKKTTPTKGNSNNTATKEKDTAEKEHATKEHSTKEHSATVQNDTTVTETKTVHTVKGHHGYRVQVFAGGNSRKDRQQAEATRNRVKSLYPEVNVTAHFFSPRWVCIAGNFRSYEEAHEMLENVRAMGYRSALILKPGK